MYKLTMFKVCIRLHGRANSSVQGPHSKINKATHYMNPNNSYLK